MKLLLFDCQKPPLPSWRTTPERYEVVYIGNILRDCTPLSIYIWIIFHPKVVQRFENQGSGETAHLYPYHFFLFLEFGYEACSLFFLCENKTKQHIKYSSRTPGQRLLCSSFRISDPYKSTTFTIYTSVYFYSVVITITNYHILSFSQVLSGVEKDYLAYVKLCS